MALRSLPLALLWHFTAHAVVTPAPDRAFATNSSGSNIIALMQGEARNPTLSNLIVHFVNNAAVDVTGDGTNDFEEWTGVLISPEWVLTCAHTLQGTNGLGGGIVPDEIFYNYGGNNFPNPASAVAAEVHIHPSWTKQNYTNGYDIALVRLAVPVVNVNVFPRLPSAAFTDPVGVLFGGFGFQGNGTTGETTNAVTRVAVGVNSLDGLGGQTLKDGYNQSYKAYSNWVSTVAFMDFDKWEMAQPVCTNSTVYTNSFPTALSRYSTMGENNYTRPVQSCPTPIQPAQEYFGATINDFVPGAGDSGGPAFEWPNAPSLPAPGAYFISSAPTLLGIMSYRARGTESNNASSVYGNTMAFTLVQPHVGWIYQVTGMPQAAPATLLQRAYDLIFSNSRILSEAAFGVDQTEIAFTTDIQNTDTGVYRDLTVQAATTALPASTTVVNGIASHESLGELGTANGSSTALTIRVANADLTAARTAILSGDAFSLAASEQQVYTGPPKYIDKQTDDAFESTTFNLLGELVLVFKSETVLISGLQSGDILIADPTSGAYDPKTRPPTTQEGIPFLGEQIPFEVSSVSTVNDKIHVAGHKRDIWEILKSGTFAADDSGAFRDLYDPPVENTYTEAEKRDRTNRCEIIRATDPDNTGLIDLCGLNALPWHFNEVKINDHLKLSGQLMLRSSGLRTELSFRDFAMKRASVGLDAGLVASLVLETTGSNNNQSVPIAQKQKELVNIPMPVLPITVAGIPCTIGMAFVLSVGAEANAPGGLSIPLETSINVGTEIGWTNGQYFSTPISEFAAPHVSDPTVFDAVNLNARAWAEARLELNFTVAGGFAKAGPSLAIRAEANFDVAPFNDPWWTLDAGAEMIGAFELDFLGLNVARVATTNDLGSFFHREANGALLTPPLAPGSRAKNASAGPVDLSPKAGEDVRWGLAFAAPNSAGAAYDKGFIEPLSGGGYFVGGGSAIPSFLGVISHTGTVQWMQQFPTGAKPVDAEELADGTVIVVGTLGFDWWIAKYDTNGTRLWVQSRRVSTALRDLAMLTAPNGDPEFYLAGFQNPVLITQSEPVVMKLDKDGNLIWTKVFTLADDDEVYAIRALRDGNLLLVGRTDSNVGTDLFIGANNNGLVMKMSPAGEIIWARAVAGHWGMTFRDAVEAPDGTLYVVGAHGDLVLDFYPSIMVAQFSANGSLQKHVLIGEDNDFPDELPDAGDTPYDSATHAVWTENGLVVVGNTGLGGSLTAWAACLTDELGVRWLSAFDGPNACAFEDVAVTDAGIVAMGWAQNVWPGTFSNRAPAWLLSLPWEGLMRFHPSTGVKSKYLQPHVFLSSEDLDFLGRYTDANQHEFFINTAPVVFATSNATATAGANVTAGVMTEFTTVRLERIEPFIVDSYETWTAYHQMAGTNATATGDFDRDGLKNGFEFFFGTDPLIGSPNAPPKIALQYDALASTVSIDFNRARAAICQPFNLQYTTNFTGWLTASNATLQLRGSDDLFDLLRLTLPAPDPNQAFFRLEVPFP